MAHAHEIVAHNVDGSLICTSCDTTTQEGEVAFWDVETDDVCSLCSRPLHRNAKRYSIGSNMPGYMPDSDPYVMVGTFEEAKRHLISDLENGECYAETEDEATEFSHAMQEVNLWSTPDTIRAGQYVYWIAEA